MLAVLDLKQQTRLVARAKVHPGKPSTHFCYFPTRKHREAVLVPYPRFGALGSLPVC